MEQLQITAPIFNTPLEPMWLINWVAHAISLKIINNPEKFKQAIAVLKEGVKNFKLLGLYAQNKGNIPTKLGEKIEI